ncbi:FABP family protein [Streptomyces sp. NPDC127190]|uniref:FABP family protein n=1 Tax=unclassified Streptomyces TaxID=2593676 RepID=UPI00362A26F5
MLDSAQAPFPDSHVAGVGPEPHPWLAPAVALLGRWLGTGTVGYGTMAEELPYAQEITFSHDGRPFLRYEARAWLTDADGRPVRPSGRETGWWRVMPDGYLEAVVAHPTGIVTTYVGRISGSEIEMTSRDMAVTPLAKEVTGSRRSLRLDGDELTVVQELEAVGEPLQQHLSTRLRRRPA